MAKLDNPQGAVETVANANELKEQLDAVTAEKVELGNEKATLETSVTSLTGENTELKNEIQSLKDLLTTAELKVSGNESLVTEKTNELEVVKGQLEQLQNETAEKITTLETEKSKALADLAERDAKILELTKEVIETVEDLQVAEQAADAVVEQNELLDKHLQTKGAKPDVTDGVKDKEKADAIDRFKDLRKKRNNARSRTDKAEYDAQLRRLQNGEHSQAIVEYLNSEYGAVKPEKEEIFLSDADKAIYAEYKDWTNKRAKAMSESGTLENRRKNQASYQREANKMLADPVKSAAIRRVQSANE
jgi:hypothetical protein